MVYYIPWILYHGSYEKKYHGSYELTIFITSPSIILDLFIQCGFLTMADCGCMRFHVFHVICVNQNNYEECSNHSKVGLSRIHSMDRQIHHNTDQRDEQLEEVFP